eukprot:6288704-Prymnesium_polylepis.1
MLCEGVLWVGWGCGGGRRGCGAVGWCDACQDLGCVWWSRARCVEEVLRREYAPRRRTGKYKTSGGGRAAGAAPHAPPQPG